MIILITLCVLTVSGSNWSLEAMYEEQNGLREDDDPPPLGT